MIARLATALALVVVTGLSILRIAHAPASLPATAPDTVFSAERALKHVAEIAKRPHPMGTEEHDRVRDYILAQLTALGMPSEIQTATAIGTRYQEAGRVQNIIGYMHGREANQRALLLMVHYDGVEAGPAAADDGAGVGALLETLRAMTARRTPLQSDIIALFTDGEESGLLGAAAFVREHPRARDVAIALNFEARGTSGRSYMFETGSGNLDAVRALRTASDVTAGSVFTTIYRTLPNDTDLSELALLHVPALNFAFADGVERYHTSHDAVAYLNPGSVQHHGVQMLALARVLAGGALPRPVTGDAVFFDFPLLGLIVYPTWVAMPLALLLAGLTVIVVREEAQRKRMVAGLVAMAATMAVCAVAASFIRLSAPAVWSGAYGIALALTALAVNSAVYLAVDRDGTRAAHTGALVLLALLAATLSFAVPAVSYILVWPTLFALIAHRSRRVAAEWIAAIVALMMLAGFAYAVSAVMLGIAGAGAIALVVLTSILTWLLAPLIARVFTGWKNALGVVFVLSACVTLYAKLTVKQSAWHPARSSLVFAQNADSGDAFFGSTSTREPWTRLALGAVERGPEWTSHAGPFIQSLYGHPAPRATLDAPTITIVSDSTSGGVRTATVRVNAPRGTTAIVVRVNGTTVARATIDGRVVDTTRFRRPSAIWATEYWNVPPEGAVFAFQIAAGQPLVLDVSARRPGLPASVTVPARPDDVVASQAGDVSVVYRSARF